MCGGRVTDPDLQGPVPLPGRAVSVGQTGETVTSVPPRHGGGQWEKAKGEDSAGRGAEAEGALPRGPPLKLSGGLQRSVLVRV